MNLSALADDKVNSIMDESLENVVYFGTFEVSEDGISPRSSVGGFNQVTITSSSNAILIECNGSGWGGMGITIKTSSSYGPEGVSFHGASVIGSASSIDGNMSTIDEKVFNNLWQMDLQEYCIAFDMAHGTNSFFVQVWIYG